LLSLAFVIVMPLALGQSRSRESKPSVAAAQMPQVAAPLTAASARKVAVPNLPASQLPKVTSGPAGAHRLQIPPAPQAPQVILYDQYNNLSGVATSSQDFEAAFDAFDDFTADDFVVPASTSWSIESVDADGTYDGFPGPALSFNVFFYSDSGTLPGALVASRTGMSYTQSGSTFSVTVSPAVCLTSGTYWVSVQARMDFGVGGQWYWTDRTVQSNNGAAWQNPGGGFGVCPTWGRKTTCIGAVDPDQVYRLNGTIGCGGGTPTPTPTPTATPTCSPGVLWYNGDFDNVNGLANGNVVGFDATVYDNFIVPAGGGWTVTSVFTNDLLDTSAGITTADWDIRTGVSEGNPGTVVASALAAPATATATGRSGFGLIEYTIEVSGLNVNLAPGTYWLSVRPISGITFLSYCSSTVGLNCVGLPCGNDDNAFFTSSTFGYFYHTTTDPLFDPNNDDFSMGVNGVVNDNCGPTPTPTATPTPTPGHIQLRGRGHVHGDVKQVQLQWRGATTPTVDVWRNGVIVAVVPNSGSYQEVLTVMGTYIYHVCDHNTANCSNDVGIRF
jgi:hypothetical protein